MKIHGEVFSLNGKLANQNAQLKVMLLAPSIDLDEITRKQAQIQAISDKLDLVRTIRSEYFSDVDVTELTK